MRKLNSGSQTQQSRFAGVEYKERDVPVTGQGFSPVHQVGVGVGVDGLAHITCIRPASMLQT